MRTLWTAAGLWSFSQLAACTTSSTGVAAADSAAATCPATLDAAVGASCPLGGLVCYPQYVCGASAAIATCTCTGGIFACTDVMGRSLAEGGAPACPATPATEACPATEILASEHACTETGRICDYASTCAGSQTYDACQCISGALSNGQVGLRFQCTTPCDYDAALVDAGEEASADASVEDAKLDVLGDIELPGDATGGDATAVDARSE